MKKFIKNLLYKYDKNNEIIYFYNKISFLWKSDIKYYKKAYKRFFKRELNLESPQTFNEKIIKRILFEKKEIYSKLADKYLVRSWIKEKIGEEYLIRLYGVYDSVEQIDIDSLPEKFVLKCNHDSGSVIVCDNKKNFNFYLAKKKLSSHLKRNFYYMTREWHYKNIIPKIICEEKLEDITDYKFHCFNGEPKYLEVVFDRFDNRKQNVYDMDWKLADFQMGEDQNTDDEIIKPKNFEEMKKIVSILSKDFDYCRVDLYNENGNIKFGEITFTPAMGLDTIPYEVDKYLGSLWK